jgi:hypothetical protein
MTSCLYHPMAIDMQTQLQPTQPDQTLEWMQARIPDRYWESFDSIRLLDLIDAEALPSPTGPRWTPSRGAVALARLEDLDHEITEAIREHGVLIVESDLDEGAWMPEASPGRG